MKTVNTEENTKINFMSQGKTIEHQSITKKSLQSIKNSTTHWSVLSAKAIATS
jgi:hypothetical protein